MESVVDSLTRACLYTLDHKNYHVENSDARASFGAQRTGSVCASSFATPQPSGMLRTDVYSSADLKARKSASSFSVADSARRSSVSAPKFTPAATLDRESIERGVVTCLNLASWGQDHPRSRVHSANFCRIVADTFIKAPAEFKGLTQDDVLGLLLELDVEEDTDLTVLTPANHIRSWLPLILEVRQSQFYRQLASFLSNRTT